MTAEKFTVLFLLGKTGNGKSEAGNNILGTETFETSDCSSSKTVNVEVGYACRQDRKFKVIDGPGVCETRMSSVEAGKHIAKQMQLGVNRCPEGIDALILVLKYGNRFTDEEWASVSALKILFGEFFIRDYCIILFTHGDNFYKKNRKTSTKTFHDWCLEQEGKLKELFSECKHRIVLFDNFADSEHADSQLEKLLNFVDKLDGVRYTNEIFERTREAHEKARAEDDSMVKIQENIQSKLQFIINDIRRLQGYEEMNYEVRTLLNTLRVDAIQLKITIDKEDKGTGTLKKLREDVTDVIKSIDNLEAALRKDDRKSTDAELLNTFQMKLSELSLAFREVVQFASDSRVQLQIALFACKAFSWALKMGLLSTSSPAVVAYTGVQQLFLQFGITFIIG